MANGTVFAAALRKSPQAIDASAPSGTGGGRALSHEQRQKRQCAFLGAASWFDGIPDIPTEVIAAAEADSPSMGLAALFDRTSGQPDRPARASVLPADLLEQRARKDQPRDGHPPSVQSCTTRSRA
jgi:hypothetical protein